ncbi:lipase family protein [Allofrancisella frigidaquae]|nr:lipase family protein [Allofrancisella frigidaquae]
MRFHPHENNNDITIEHYENKILTNLPDKDAAVLCELVYENKVFENIVSDRKLYNSSFASIIYRFDKKSLVEDYENLLSSDAQYALKNYPHHYYPILAKYKLVATSSQLGNDVGYYGIAVAAAGDKQNKGVYVINRGTRLNSLDGIYNDLIKTDLLNMTILGKGTPITMVSNHTKSGIEFVNSLLKNYNVMYIGFAGHSLGGSIAQMQAVYFVDKRLRGIRLSPSKGFEPFGIKNEADPFMKYNNEDGALYYLTLNPIKAFKSWQCKLAAKNCSSWQGIADKLIINYTSFKSDIDFTSFSRKGDIMANIAVSVGKKVLIDSAGSYKDFKTLHEIANYRYQEYRPDGSLIETQVNKLNSDILKSSDNLEQKTKYRICFNTDTFSYRVEV